MQKRKTPDSPDILKAKKAIQLGTELFCPNCKQHYTPNIPCKSTAHFAGSHTDIEQWNSGICSDTCWSQYIQNGEEEDTIFF